MFAMGLMGVNRRLYDAGTEYALAQPTLAWQPHMTWAAVALGVFQIPFVVNLILTAKRAAADRDNPWEAKTLEWLPCKDCPPSTIQTHTIRADTGTSATRLGIWLFLASEVMFFGALFSGYVMLRAGSTDWPARLAGFPVVETLLLAGASALIGPSRMRLMIANALGFAFVVVKIGNDFAMNDQGLHASTNLLLACWFTITLVHAIHVLFGALTTGWIAGPGFKMSTEEPERWTARVQALQRYWLFVDIVWIAILLAFYVI
jgi:heme/copper-type cytochrome/quinol oxidase subunit 3